MMERSLVRTEPLIETIIYRLFKKSKNMLNPNRISFRMARAVGQSVYVKRDYGSSTIGWTYSNGISELGWYAKKDKNGGMLWCIE